MGREHRIISALAPTDVPVAPAIGICTDDSVNGGAPFYVMEWVEGPVLRSKTESEQYFDEAALDAWLASRPDLAPPERIDTTAVRIDPDQRITLGKFAGLIRKARGTVTQHRDRVGFPQAGEDGLYRASDLLEYWNTRSGHRGKASKDS